VQQLEGFRLCARESIRLRQLQVQIDPFGAVVLGRSGESPHETDGLQAEFTRFGVRANTEGAFASAGKIRQGAGGLTAKVIMVGELGRVCVGLGFGQIVGNLQMCPLTTGAAEMGVGDLFDFVMAENIAIMPFAHETTSQPFVERRQNCLGVVAADRFQQIKSKFMADGGGGGEGGAAFVVQFVETGFDNRLYFERDGKKRPFSLPIRRHIMCPIFRHAII